MDSLHEDSRLSGTAKRGNSNNLHNVLYSSSSYTCLHCRNLPVHNWRSLAYLALLQIVNGLLLTALWTYVLKSKLLVQQFKYEYNRNLYSNLAVIPSIYAISMVVGFVNVHAASIFPVFMIPVILVLSKVYRRKEA